MGGEKKVTYTNEGSIYPFNRFNKFSYRYIMYDEENVRRRGEGLLYIIFFMYIYIDNSKAPNYSLNNIHHLTHVI